MPFATIRDISVNYEMAGQGPRLLLIPGTNADLRRKPRLINGLLSQRFEVLTYDQRGLGQSGKPERSYTMDDYVEDAVALMDHVGWLDAVVLGVSFGGAVAMQLALKYPARVKRLALACSNPGGEFAYPLLELEDVAPEVRAQTILGLDLRRTPEWQAANAEKAQSIKNDIMMRGLPVDPNDSAARGGLRRQLEARKGHQVEGKLKQLSMPTALFGGRYDGLGTVAAQHAMAAEIPNSTVSLFEGGHGFLNEDPAALQAVATFLAG
ncbi:MAG: alpha/beta hydrolase [Steroidobacteraceae bacterium]